MRAGVALVLAALAAACGQPDASCDDLTGLWREVDHADRRYHISRSKRGYELYAMFDTAVPKTGDVVFAPMVIDLRAEGSELFGRWSQRRTRDADICLAIRPLHGQCADGRLTLSIERRGELDWATCKLAPADGADQLQLTR